MYEYGTYGNDHPVANEDNREYFDIPDRFAKYRQKFYDDEHPSIVDSREEIDDVRNYASTRERKSQRGDSKKRNRRNHSSRANEPSEIVIPSTEEEAMPVPVRHVLSPANDGTGAHGSWQEKISSLGSMATLSQVMKTSTPQKATNKVFNNIEDSMFLHEEGGGVFHDENSVEEELENAMDVVSYQEYKENERFANLAGLRYSESGRDVFIQDEVDNTLPSTIGGSKTGTKKDESIATYFEGDASLARRLCDFQFARRKRRQHFANSKKLLFFWYYEFLAGIKIDLDWVEQVSGRRANKEPYQPWLLYEKMHHISNSVPFFSCALVLIFSIMMIVTFGVSNWTIQPLNINPMVGPSEKVLLDLGAKDTFQIVNEGETWRIVSASLLHAGIIHFVINTVIVILLAAAVEMHHGILWAFILFFLPAIGGTIISAITVTEYVAVGVGGGIFGFLGAFTADLISYWRLLYNDFISVQKEKRCLIFLALTIILVVDALFFLGLVPFTCNFTHAAGFVYGLLCGFSMHKSVEDVNSLRTHSKLRYILCKYSGLIISIIGVIVSGVLLSKGIVANCTNCKYMSCLSLPPRKDIDNKWWYCDDCSDVMADAIMNSTTQKFDQIILTCPNEVGLNVQLGNDATSDYDTVKSLLPGYCRKFCSDLR